MSGEEGLGDGPVEGGVEVDAALGGDFNGHATLHASHLAGAERGGVDDVDRS